ncbi:MAG: AlpA family phage regulatory protein [Rhodospirillales bacterium]|nr:AlpA family phage regulatory protein [Rhodospirillales bacterium]
MKLLKINDVIELSGLSRSSVYALAQQNKFPKPLKQSERSSAWVEDEIKEWIAERIKERNESNDLADHHRMSTSEQEEDNE